MKRKNLILLIQALVFGTMISCTGTEDKEEECITTKTEYITAVNAPNKGMVGETVNIEVNFRVFNGCGGFSKFIQAENGNIRTITVEAKYEGCFCTQDIPIRMATYAFKTNNPGNYELKFKSSPTEFITVNLSIN